MSGAFMHSSSNSRSMNGFPKSFPLHDENENVLLLIPSSIDTNYETNRSGIEVRHGFDIHNSIKHLHKVLFCGFLLISEGYLFQFFKKFHFLKFFILIQKVYENMQSGISRVKNQIIMVRQCC